MRRPNLDTEKQAFSFLILLVFGFASTIALGMSEVLDQKVTGSFTIDIKHHKPQDLVITVGYLEINQDFLPNALTNGYTEAKIVWNRDSSKITDGLLKSFDFEELNFKTVKKPSKGNIVWFIEITDKGLNHLKDELTEEEKADTGNYLAGFYATFNNVTYQCFQHPFFDDGNSVRAEIYGTTNEIIDMETKSTFHPRVLGVVCVSFFRYHTTQLDPENGIDCSGFIYDFYWLTWDEIIEPYHYYYTIDDGWHKTHDRIYMSTVDSLFATIDSVTDGSSEVIMLISSHGNKFPNYFWVYDTNFLTYWWRYTAERLAKKIDKITEEGTDFFLWTHCCNSWYWYELINPLWHNNQLIWYSYKHSAFHQAIDVEYNAFENAIRYYNVRKVENLFDYADDAFFAKWGSRSMELEDFLPEYFHID